MKKCHLHTVSLSNMPGTTSRAVGLQTEVKASHKPEVSIRRAFSSLKMMPRDRLCGL